MLQLVNLSNYKSDIELIKNNPSVLEDFLKTHQLDGLEMMFCAPWDENLHKKELIHGVHLRFWPAWLDFWRGDREELLKQFGSEENIIACYGGLQCEDWLEIYRENIRTAVKAEAKYIVFHVAHARTPEVFSYKFSATDAEVVKATIEVVNELVNEIPATMELLFENLWWPGLTLKNVELTKLLLDNVKHSNVGIMLDIGHLMNTNQELKSEFEGVDYIINTLEALGDYRKLVRGVHLHQSLSGQYVKESLKRTVESYNMADIMNHVLKIDEHKPFTISEVQRLIRYIQPKYLVHEFMYSTMEEWSDKLRIQKMSIDAEEI